MHINVCDLAAQLLLKYLEHPDERGRFDAVVAHTISCQECIYDLTYLLEALRTEQADSIGCHTCEERLPDFLQAESEGTDKDLSWFAVALHLRTCPHCAAEYEALHDLENLSSEQPDSTTIHYPAPNVDFLLKQPIESEGFWALNALGHLCIYFSEALLQAFQSSPTLLSGLKSGSPRQLLRFDVDKVLEGIDVEVVAEQSSLNTEVCNIVVSVTSPDLEWPELAGSTVILRINDETTLSQETDPFGEAVFGEIAKTDLPRLTIEVRPLTI